MATQYSPADLPMRRLRVSSFLLGTLLLGAGVALPAAAAQEPAAPAPALTTVSFEDVDATLEGFCIIDASGTITFSATGTATGAYPGPYTATGTIIVSNQPVIPGISGINRLASFTETFTINSPVGKVAGTKVLRGTPTESSGSCLGDLPGGTLFEAVAEFSDLRYTAEITTPDGRRFTDEGRARASVENVQAQQIDIREFNEQFISNFATAQPVCDVVKDKPGDDKDKCKDKK